MLVHLSWRLSNCSRRTACGLLALALLAYSLSGCVEDAPPSAPQPTRAPRATPAAAAPATPRPTSAARPAAEADWTVLVYLDGDNNLEQDAIGDYAEMASVGSNQQLN